MTLDQTEILEIFELISEVDNLVSNFSNELIKILDINIKDEWYDTSEEAEEKELIKIIISQYTLCTRYLDKFFKYIKWQAWEKDWIWNCGIDVAMSEQWLCWPACYDIIDIRNWIKKNELRKWNVLWKDACLYHKQWEWCVLWEFKAPRCICYPSWNLPKSYDYYYLKDNLEKILVGWYDKKSYKYFPQKNNTLVHEYLQYLKKLYTELKEWEMKG